MLVEERQRSCSRHIGRSLLRRAAFLTMPGDRVYLVENVLVDGRAAMGASAPLKRPHEVQTAETTTIFNAKTASRDCMWRIH